VPKINGRYFWVAGASGRAMTDNEFVFGFDEQLPGLSKIETIDYCWLLRRGDRCGPLELRKKEELERKHRAALRDGSCRSE
jgi:hypothetical protein